MATPLISGEVLQLLKDRFDVPARMKDTDNEIRWKAAQRAVVLDMEALHVAQSGMREEDGVRTPMKSNIDPRKLD